MISQEKIIVLRTYKYRESDLVIHGINPLGARLSFLARGGLKSRKRFAGGVLQPTHYIQVTYQVRSSGDSDPLHNLLEAHLLKEFAGLRSDYARLELALEMLRLVHKLSQHGVVDAPEVFTLLGNALKAAEASTELDILRLQFELKILASQGVLPIASDYQPWLKLSLADHLQIKTSVTDRQDLAVEVGERLQAYLNGLS